MIPHAGLFSATQTEAVEALARAGLRNPVRVNVAVTLAQPPPAKKQKTGAKGSSTGEGLALAALPFQRICIVSFWRHCFSVREGRVYAEGAASYSVRSSAEGSEEGEVGPAQQFLWEPSLVGLSPCLCVTGLCVRGWEGDRMRGGNAG